MRSERRGAQSLCLVDYLCSEALRFLPASIVSMTIHPCHLLLTIQSHLTPQVDDGPNPIRARSCPQTRERGLDFGVNAGIIALAGLTFLSNAGKTATRPE